MRASIAEVDGLVGTGRVGASSGATTLASSHGGRAWLPVLMVAAVVVVLGGGTLLARRRGYSVGGDTVVRCRQGHLFTTLWIPGASLKSIRLGWARYQRCPVGKHWSIVTPVKEADLTEEQLLDAHRHHDIRIP